MKKFIKKALKVTAILFVSLIVYALIVTIMSYIQVNSNPKSVDENTKIPVFILTNGVHTDIVVPIKNEYYDWSKKISIYDTKAKDSLVNFVAFGWGDKGFYLDTPTWANLKVSTALKAISGFNTTAMHVTFYKDLKENKSCVKFFINPEDYIKLTTYIETSFQQNDGQFIKVETDAVYGNNDVFYDAIGHYSLFYTCNSWANQALKAANQKAALWTITDTGIFRQYQ